MKLTAADINLKWLAAALLALLLRSLVPWSPFAALSCAGVPALA